VLVPVGVVPVGVVSVGVVLVAVVVVGVVLVGVVVVGVEVVSVAEVVVGVGVGAGGMVRVGVRSRVCSQNGLATAEDAKPNTSTSKQTTPKRFFETRLVVVRDAVVPVVFCIHGGAGAGAIGVVLLCIHWGADRGAVSVLVLCPHWAAGTGVGVGAGTPTGRGPPLDARRRIRSQIGFAIAAVPKLKRRTNKKRTPRRVLTNFMLSFAPSPTRVCNQRFPERCTGRATR
jgi:hypothetical protein